MQQTGYHFGGEVCFWKGYFQPALKSAVRAIIPHLMRDFPGLLMNAAFLQCSAQYWLVALAVPEPNWNSSMPVLLVKSLGSNALLKRFSDT